LASRSALRIHFIPALEIDHGKSRSPIPLGRLSGVEERTSSILRRLSLPLERPPNRTLNRAAPSGILAPGTGLVSQGTPSNSPLASCPCFARQPSNAPSLPARAHILHIQVAKYMGMGRTIFWFTPCSTSHIEFALLMGDLVKLPPRQQIASSLVTWDPAHPGRRAPRASSNR
jgi:hypothetical protein